jgi:ketosteroid isomerase-like protein
MTMSDDERRAANKKVFTTVTDTITAGEFEKLGDYMSDDLLFELPYAGKFLPDPIQGLEKWNQMQLMTFGMFESFRLELREFHDCLDPDELVAEYQSDAVVKRNGNAYKNRYIGVLRFRDGKIAEWKEFHNPKATDVL